MSNSAEMIETSTAYRPRRDEWRKDCPKCRRTFFGTGDIAEKALARHFAFSFWTIDRLQGYCKSCANDIGNGRVLKDRDAILKRQNGACAICCAAISFDTLTAHVDHDHTTGLTRGALCIHCNLHVMRAVDAGQRPRRRRLMAAAVAYRDFHRWRAAAVRKLTDQRRQSR
jgi:hypothetical protein